MKMRLAGALGLGLLVFMLVGKAAAQETVVRLITHDSFAVSDSVLEAFEAETGLTVEILRVGDAGLMVNQSILTRDNPLGDVLFGVDNTFLSRALDADLFEEYESPLRDNVDPVFLEGIGAQVTPVDFGDVCLNFDAAWFSEHGVELPESLADLTKPEYRSLLAVENPATSSPGLAFLLATVAAYGDNGYEQFWADLVANDVAVSESWTDAYYGQFSGSTGSTGTRPLVVSYASSPAAEVYFAEEHLSEPPTGSITVDGACFRQIEYAGVLSGAANPEGAQRFIDFLLTPAFQADMPLNMFVYPVVPDVDLPEVYVPIALPAEVPASMTPDEIGALRDDLLERWTEIVLR